MDSPTDAPPGAGTPPPPPPPHASRPRRLERRPEEGHLGGVCAGVAEYFDVDPVIVRIAAVVLAFSGPGVVAYVLAWVFVPEATTPRRVDGASAAVPGADKDKGAQVLGIVLLGVSAAFLWGDWWSPARQWLFPLGLMALGAWLVLRTTRSGEEPVVAPHVQSSADATSEAAADQAPVTTEGTVAPWAHDGPPWTTVVGPAEPPPLRDRRRRVVVPSVFGALLVWSGAGWLLGVSLQTGLAVALCIVGIGFVVGAFMGGAWSLLVPAVVLAGALVVVSTIDIPLRGPIGERSWVPASAAELDDRYEMSMGEGTLDLRQLELEDGQRVAVEAGIGLGHLIVNVPAGVGVEITAEAGAGETDLLGRQNSGVGVSATANEGADPGAGTIELDLQVGLGQIEVRQERTGSAGLR